MSFDPGIVIFAVAAIIVVLGATALEIRKNLKGRKQKRLTVVLDDETAKKFAEIKSRRGLSDDAAISRCIGTEIYFQRKVDAGCRILLADSLAR